MHSQELLTKCGFRGSLSIGSLQEATSQIRLLPRMIMSKIPNSPGVYVIITPPEFIFSLREEVIRGKHLHLFAKADMPERWVKDTDIIYIGRAGGSDIIKNLPDRIKLLIRHSLGKTTLHRGGQDIWLLEQDGSFLLYWKGCDDPKTMERNLLEEFKIQHHGKLPFGNKKAGDC